MHEWGRNIQDIIFEIDKCIKNGDDAGLPSRNYRGILGIPNFMFQENSEKYPV